MSKGKKIQNNPDRIIGIDILKVFAVFLVLNSHMSICYGDYSFLATGGAFGDSLFFFCSGFTLFLGRKLRFDNWYKRRVARIFPSLLAVAVIACIFWNATDNIVDILLGKKYWFIACILIYYVLIYPFKKYSVSLKFVYVCIAILILLIYYWLYDYNDNGLIYGKGSFRYFLFFLFMMQGAMMGNKIGLYKFKPRHVAMLLICVISWYGILFLGGNSSLQIISVVPLLGVTYYSYLFACAPFWKKLYEKKFAGNFLFITGNLCLEVYLIQKYVFTGALNDLFPLNIPIIMLTVFIVAYIARIFAMFISQTLQSEPYEWKKMLLSKN